MDRLAQEFSAQLKTSEGRQRIAQENIYGPFLEGKYWVGHTTKILLKHVVGADKYPKYHKDRDLTAVSISEHGQAQVKYITDEWVEPRSYPITVFLRFPIIDIETCNYDLIDQHSLKAQAKMAEKEDIDTFAALLAATPDAGGTGYNNVVTGYSSLSRDCLSEAYVQIINRNAPVGNIMCSSLDYKDFLVWTDADFGREKQNELIKTGLMGDLWGAAVRQIPTRILAENTAYVTAVPENLGVFTIQIELGSKDAAGYTQGLLEEGLIFFEYVVPTVLLTTGAVRITLS